MVNTARWIFSKVELDISANRLFRKHLPHGFSNKIKQSKIEEPKVKRPVDMTSAGMNGLNIRTNASPK